MKKFLIFIYILFLIFVLSMYGENRAVDRDVRKIVKKITPSIVKVVAQDGRRYIASGIAIERDLVISNAKVARHPFRKILLFTYDGKSYDASVVGKDSMSSIILLKTEKKVFTPLKEGKPPETGEWVGLTGVFYKDFPYFKEGIVSSANENEIILNATVMPGTAGGAIVNDKGELIGMIRGMIGYNSMPRYVFKDNSTELTVIPTEKKRHDQCYAISSGKVKKIVKELKQFGYVRRGWLGVNISGLPGKYVVVENVEQGSPAYKYGLRRNDLILKVDDKIMRDASMLVKAVRDKTPGEKLNFLIRRDGKKISLKVAIGDLRERQIGNRTENFLSFSDRFPVIPELIESLPEMNNFVYRISGPVSLNFDIVPLTPELALEFKIPERSGLLISKIKNGKVQGSGLRVGDILVRVDKKSVKTPDDLKKKIFSQKKNDKVQIDYYRKGKLMRVKVKPEMLAGGNVMLRDLKSKLSDIRFWMEQSEKRKLKRELEKLKALEAGKLREVYEKELRKKEKMELEHEKEMLKKEYLKRVKEEIEKLKLEMKKMEKELKRKKELKAKKKNDGLPGF